MFGFEFEFGFDFVFESDSELVSDFEFGFGVESESAFAFGSALRSATEESDRSSAPASPPNLFHLFDASRKMLPVPLYRVAGIQLPFVKFWHSNSDKQELGIRLLGREANFFS